MVETLELSNKAILFPRKIFKDLIKNLILLELEYYFILNI